MSELSLSSAHLKKSLLSILEMPNNKKSTEDLKSDLYRNCNVSNESELDEIISKLKGVISYVGPLCAFSPSMTINNNGKIEIEYLLSFAYDLVKGRGNTIPVGKINAIVDINGISLSLNKNTEYKETTGFEGILEMFTDIESVKHKDLAQSANSTLAHDVMFKGIYQGGFDSTNLFLNIVLKEDSVEVNDGVVFADFDVVFDGKAYELSFSVSRHNWQAGFKQNSQTAQLFLDMIPPTQGGAKIGEKLPSQVIFEMTKDKPELATNILLKFLTRSDYFVAGVDLSNPLLYPAHILYDTLINSIMSQLRPFLTR